MVTQQPKGNALRGLMPLRWSILILLLRPQGLLGDETAAGLVGLNTTLIKVGAFGIGAAIAGALLRRPSAIRSEWRGQDDAVQSHYRRCCRPNLFSRFCASSSIPNQRNLRMSLTSSIDALRLVKVSEGRRLLGLIMAGLLVPVCITA
jgi:hypothetical protein